MKRLITAAVTAAMVAALCVPASAVGFTDVPDGAWYTEAVTYCQDRGLMSGIGSGQFLPNGAVTRAQLATLLRRLSGSPAAPAGTTFHDTAPESWYYQDVCWVAQTGYMGGYPDGRFGPEDPITREQLATVLWRYSGSPAGYASPGFADQGTISDYALEAVSWARSEGILNGVEGNRFAPREGATRAQMAMVLMNYTSRPGALTEVSAMDIMCQPCGVAVTADGSLLVTDSYNKVIWLVKDGRSTLYAGGDTVEDLSGQPIGGYNDAPLKESYFKKPWAIAPFLDGWAISDTDNDVVRLLRPESTETVNGSTSERLRLTDLGVAFNRPTGLAADPEGNLYVADFGENAVRKITPEGTVTTFCAGLSEPMGLCWWNGELYVAESGANRVVKVKDRQITVVAGSGQAGFEDGPAARAAFAAPQAVTLGTDGTVYVSDTDNCAIRMVRNGQVSTLAVRDLSDLNAFFPVSPAGLALRGNTLYVCDTLARKLLALPLGGGAP